MTAPARQRVRSLLSGHAGVGGIAVPLALHPAARIQERDAGDFVYDPTELANALRDLVDAVQPDGVPVTSPEVLLAGCTRTAAVVASPQLSAAVAAATRLRASYGDGLALAAALPGPAAIARACAADAGAATDTLLALAKVFLAAGVDILLIADETEFAGAQLSTVVRVAAFHQALVLGHREPRYGLTAATAVPLEAPRAGVGVTVTEEELVRITDITALRTWVDAVRT